MFNMRREAERTLFSLSAKYQRHIDSKLWEVLVIDNGSSIPLNEDEVSSFGANFRYCYFETISCSPVQAINYGVEQANGELISICIDGARILTPGILRYTLDCFKLFNNPFVCTLGWHLGSEMQNLSVKKGYNQAVEDNLLEKTDWQNDGYQLFDIGSLAGSCPEGYFSPIVESNFFTIKKTTYQQAYGYDIRFIAPGGGMANLDFYKRISEHHDVQTIHLLGEGTFHQFHGGVTSNVPPSQHPRHSIRAQYKLIRGEEYTKPSITPVYFGRVPKQAMRFIHKYQDKLLLMRVMLKIKHVIRSVSNYMVLIK